MSLLHRTIITTLAWGTFLVPFTLVSSASHGRGGASRWPSAPIPDMGTHFQSILSQMNHTDTTKSHLPLQVSAEAEVCSAHLNTWATDILSTWSIQMLDAMSKIPEGVLSGHTTSLGDFDECLATRGEIDISGMPSHFKGQYCTAFLLPGEMCQDNAAAAETRAAAMKRYKMSQAMATESGRGPLLEVLFMFGFPGGALCVPDKCKQPDLQNILLASSNGTGVCILLSDCQTDDKPSLRPGDIVMITILAVIAALMCVGTAVDLSFPRTQSQSQSPKAGSSMSMPVSKPVQALIAFSFYTNTKKWLSTSGGSDNLGCIHGIRFLSTCWVVLAHTWSTWLMKIWNLTDVIMTYKDWTIYPVINGTVSVDTFFTLAGLLASYSILKMLDKTKGKLNVPMLYVHRYLRLTPTYAILVGIMATWFEYLRAGPHTAQFAIAGESCRNNWWHNLLYINNLVKYSDTDPGNQMCHGESWYLGNDMQFFLISPLLIWPLWKWPIIGSLIMGAFTLASVVVPFVVTYVYELNATLLIVSGNDPAEFMEKSYIKPWMRFGPYIVGLWAGYILYHIRKRRTPIKLPALVVIFGWATSTAMALAIIFGAMSFFDPEVEYERLNGAFYAGLHRFGWGLVISWIVLACTLGYGGIINRFLSWKVFIPLGRLSFCVYLISMWLQTLYYASARQHITYDLYTAINHFFGHMVLSLLVSFVACMAFESPFIALEKILFSEGVSLPNSKPPAAAHANTQSEGTIEPEWASKRCEAEYSGSNTSASCEKMEESVEPSAPSSENNNV